MKSIGLNGFKESFRHFKSIRLIHWIEWANRFKINGLNGLDHLIHYPFIIRPNPSKPSNLPPLYDSQAFDQHE